MGDNDRCPHVDGEPVYAMHLDNGADLTDVPAADAERMRPDDMLDRCGAHVTSGDVGEAVRAGSLAELVAH